MKRKKSSLTLTLLIIGAILYKYYYFDKDQKQGKVIKNEAVLSGDVSDLLPTSTTGQVVFHDNYTLSYNEHYEQAEWVAYDLKEPQLKKHKYKRPYFEKDKKVKTKSAHYKAYKNSGYDKGHLCPAGDRRFSREAHDETFLTSNISPQKHDFNAGVWNRLEQKTRYWAKKYHGVYVVTGGILSPNLKTIGRDKVGVPKQFYKIIFDSSEPKAIAFIMPHQESDKALYKFVTSIDHIEELTGIDFFAKLPDELENRLEASTSYKDWSFR